MLKPSEVAHPADSKRHGNQEGMTKKIDLRVLSLGAGVQSTAMYIMAARGELTPMPDVAIFADTQAEPAHVYEHLDSLEERYGDIIPIHRVTRGNLEKDCLEGNEDRRKFAAIPLYVKDGNGKSSILRRQCTREYKIAPIHQEMRRLLGLKKGQRVSGKYVVEMWVGISLDEIARLRDSTDKWIDIRYPFVFDRPMRRGELISWLRDNGWSEPRKSACYFCPFHDDGTWRDMKANEPDTWARAVEFDRRIREGVLSSIEDEAFTHRSLKPLEDIDFGSIETTQMGLPFQEECQGMCGV